MVLYSVIQPSHTTCTNLANSHYCTNDFEVSVSCRWFTNALGKPSPSSGIPMLHCLLLDAADFLGLVIGFWWQRSIGGDVATIQTETQRQSQVLQAVVGRYEEAVETPITDLPAFKTTS